MHPWAGFSASLGLCLLEWEAGLTAARILAPAAQEPAADPVGHCSFLVPERLLAVPSGSADGPSSHTSLSKPATTPWEVGGFIPILHIKK